MKFFKIISLIIVVSSISLLMTGCGNKNIEGSLEEIMTKVYSTIPKDQRPMMLENTKVNKENIEYYLGSKDIEFEEALASESAVGSIAHSVVLIRTKENADINSIKEKIKNSVNPRKWVCVGVEKEDLIVENKGNLIILIMVEDQPTREKLSKKFNELQ